MNAVSRAKNRRVAATLLALAATRVPVPGMAAPASPIPAETAAAAGKTIEYDSETFTLANSARNESVETDEYTVSGEKISNWTQLVTLQRLTVAKPTDTEAFVDFFRQRMGEDGASLDVLSHRKAASVFAVRFPKSEQNDEQVMICLAFVATGKPSELNIVQYAIKPTRCPLDVTSARIKGWRDRFLHEAEALCGK